MSAAPRHLRTALQPLTSDLRVYRITEPLDGRCATDDTACTDPADLAYWTDGDGELHSVQTCRACTVPAVRAALHDGVHGEVTVEIGVPAVLADTQSEFGGWTLHPRRGAGGAHAALDHSGRPHVRFGPALWGRDDLPRLVEWLLAVHAVTGPVEGATT